MWGQVCANVGADEGNHAEGAGQPLDEARAFLDRSAKRSGAHSSEVVTLVVPEEMDAAKLARFPRKMSLRSFVHNEIWQIDMAQSQLGFCGR